jgi:3-oxoacyl-[acyl-carrier protein] reductase
MKIQIKSSKGGSMNLKVNNKIAVVTGGGRGIGEAICMGLANEGAHVVVADIDSSTIRGVAEKIRGTGRKALPVEADISNRVKAAGLMKEVIREFGRIDIVVNNAGISPKKNGNPPLTWEIEEEEWDRVMGVNLKGTLFCCQEAVKYMLPNQAGSIVNISSIAGKAPNEPMPTGAHYNASKAGIINLTQKLAKELAAYGIRVNAIAPGRIATPMAKLASKEINQTMLDCTPIGRFGTPEEVANLVLFLSSDVAGYITGETININGGWFMD